MKKLFLALLAAMVLGSCFGIRFVSDYDEVLDRGITEFAEQFNAHVKNMGDLAGTPEGTFEANRKIYNTLDAKLDVMIARAAAAAEGKGCRLEKKVLERIKNILQSHLPAELQFSDSAVTGSSSGCNERLLVLVKEQLALVKLIHKETDKCGEKNLSCLRPATAKTALGIANQSINAVAVVEAAKKQ